MKREKSECVVPFFHPKMEEGEEEEGGREDESTKLK